MADETDRLGRLEREVAILRAEFARLREHIGGLPPVESPRRAVSSAPPSPSTPPPLSTPLRPASPLASSTAEADQPSTAHQPPDASGVPLRQTGPSVEQIVGRYGTIAVATVTVLVAVG